MLLAAFGLPNYVELAVCLHFADKYGLVQVMVLFIHLRHDAALRVEGLTRHRCNPTLSVSVDCLLNRLLPHVNTNMLLPLGHWSPLCRHLANSASSPNRGTFFTNLAFSAFLIDMK